MGDKSNIFNKEICLVVFFMVFHLLQSDKLNSLLDVKLNINEKTIFVFSPSQENEIVYFYPACKNQNCSCCSATLSPCNVTLFCSLVKPVAGRTLELAKLGTEAIELEHYTQKEILKC